MKEHKGRERERENGKTRGIVKDDQKQFQEKGFFKNWNARIGGIYTKKSQ